MPRPKKQKLKRRKDGRYVAIYKGKPFYGSSSDEALAAREQFKQLEMNTLADAVLSPPLESYAKKWLQSYNPNVSFTTMVKIKLTIQKLIDKYGYYRLDEIKPADLKNLYTDAFSGCSDCYIKTAAALYRTFFDSAVDEGYCKINPARAKSANPHRGKIGSHRAITDEERKWIETLCTDHRMHPAAMVMLYAGLRPQEVKALDISKAANFKTMELHITDCVHKLDNNKYYINNIGKTAKADRIVPIFPPLYKAIKNINGPIVSNQDGKMITAQGWASLWKSYTLSMEKAINGYPYWMYGNTKEHKKLLAENKPLPPYTRFTVVPYDLRHSFCTFCRNNGVEINTTIHWMGHANANMILKIYDEYSQVRGQREAQKINNNVFHVQNDVQKDNE